MNTVAGNAAEGTPIATLRHNVCATSRAASAAPKSRAAST
jgi:hypothetical protein